jgi:hypothetical protein
MLSIPKNKTIRKTHTSFIVLVALLRKKLQGVSLIFSRWPARCQAVVNSATSAEDTLILPGCATVIPAGSRHLDVVNQNFNFLFTQAAAAPLYRRLTN